MEIYVSDLDRVVSVTHQLKKGKDPILSMAIIEPTEAPAPAPEGSMNCQCRLPLSFPDGSFASSRMLVRGGSSSLSSSSGLSSLLPTIASSIISTFLGQALNRWAQSFPRAVCHIFKKKSRKLHHSEIPEL